MTTPIQAGWTEARTERAKAMWVAGSSASEIATALKGISRNAVIGKMMRLGLKRADVGKPTRLGPQNVGRGGAAALAKAKAAKPVELKARRAIHASPTINTTRMQPMPPAKAGRVFDATAAKVWTERRFGECAYPVGGEGAETLSCCLPAEPRGYCRRHAATMFVASPAKAVAEPSRRRRAA